ncbi:hypothetical protein [Actinophytocola sp.]|uniref:hypothetical protein n=1 Tax=Actinophytocola sp. TaxID=1872138 RepID=UPI0025C5D4C5|nr:hypothetical protein [Actinophytocola sp.]
MDHDESVLMASLASANTRIARYILGTLDRDAARPHPPDDGAALGHDLVELGNAVRRHARLRSVTWGHADREPHRRHVRASDGTAVCGALLVEDLSPDMAAASCSACRTLLARQS